MRWFRMYAEIVNDPKVQRLSAEQFRFWVNCLALAAENGGYLPSVQDISWTLRRSAGVVSALIAQLHEAELLDREGDTFSPHNWCIRQYKSDTSTDRVREHRKKRNVSGNVSVTPPDTDTDTDTDTEQSNTRAPENGALALVKPSGKRPKKPHRTMEEIEAALGPRMEWWGWFWKVFPCHEGKRDAMDAYERIVKTHDLAAEIYRGAQRYGARIQADPTARVKWAQGWLNAQRWKDEIDARASPHMVRERSFVADVESVMTRNIQETGKPW